MQRCEQSTWSQGGLPEGKHQAALLAVDHSTTVSVSQSNVPQIAQIAHHVRESRLFQRGPQVIEHTRDTRQRAQHRWQPQCLAPAAASLSHHSLILAMYLVMRCLRRQNTCMALSSAFSVQKLRGLPAAILGTPENFLLIVTEFSCNAASPRIFVPGITEFKGILR